MTVNVSGSYSTRLQTLAVRADAPVVNWGESRVVTPGDVLGYRTAEGLRLMTDNPVQIFRQGRESQGLFFEGDRAVAGTVTGKIKSSTKRTQEKKSTHIQYDKNRVKQKRADFRIDRENYRTCVNYDGGHIIDHKFSAEDSHTTEGNYFPQHFYYNQTIKEYLVQPSRCDAFIEIPLYTPKPPRIGVLGQGRKYHPIPAAIIFIQIKANKIENVYCFPNNKIDYKKLSNQLKSKKAETISSYFRLNPALHQLFRPAIIDAIAEKEQISREEKFSILMEDVTQGMSFTECKEDVNVITQLCSNVLHGKNVDPKICLSTPHFNRIEQELSCFPFNLLGEHLVKYSLRNALKSEVISTNSRLIITNIIIDFIENHHEVSEKALDFIETLAPEFHKTLETLMEIADTMQEKELLFFIDTVLHLANPFCDDFSMEGRGDLYDASSLYKFLRQGLSLLGIYFKNFSIDRLTRKQADHMIDIVGNVQVSLDYLLENGCPEEEFEDLLPVLSEAAQGALLLLKKRKESGFSTTFETGPNRMRMVRTSTGFLESRISGLVLNNHFSPTQEGEIKSD